MKEITAPVPPNVTVMPAAEKPVPVIISGVIPVVGPPAIERDETVGGLVLVKLSPAVLVLTPAALVTSMSTSPPGVAGGMVTVIEVAVTTVNAAAVAPPTVTPVVPVNRVPVSVTVVPVGPLEAVTAVTVGWPAACAGVAPPASMSPAVAMTTAKSAIRRVPVRVSNPLLFTSVTSVPWGRRSRVAAVADRSLLAL